MDGKRVSRKSNTGVWGILQSENEDKCRSSINILSYIVLGVLCISGLIVNTYFRTLMNEQLTVTIAKTIMIITL